MSERPLRVAITVPAFLKAPDFGGPVAKVATLAEALAARGHDVTVLTADYGPQRTRVPAETVNADGYTTHYLRTALRYRWIPIVARNQFARVEWNFDVVHVCGLRDGVGFGAMRRARKHSIPYVVEPLGMAAAWLRNTWAKRVYDALFSRRQMAGAACVIATSDAELAQIEAYRYVLRDLVVRPNPVTTSRAGAAAKPHADGPVEVLFVGRICRTKNLPALLEAVQPLANVRLTIAGPDDNDGTREAMAPLVAALGDRVVLHGWVDGAARDALLDSADIAVLPSITENFGNYAAEAAARRRPVVVTNAAGIAGLLGDAAVVVDPTMDGLRAGIAQLAADPALRDAYAERGFARVAALAPAEVAAAQERIYHDALRSSDRWS